MNFKRLSIVIAWALISALLFDVSAWAAEIKLKDETLIVGEIQQDKLKLRTSYGEIEINVEDITSIVEEKVTLRDGSILKGDIIDPQLIVTTKYGEFNINTKDIASIVFAEEGVKIEKKAPAVIREKPLTSKELVKYHDMEQAEEASAAYVGLAVKLGFGAGVALLGGLVIGGLVPEAGTLLLVAGLASGGGALWSWNRGKAAAEKAKKLREELEGRALLKFQNKDDRLWVRIQMPSFEVDSETGQLRWNLINYSF